jgi:hypothetical protein
MDETFIELWEEDQPRLRVLTAPVQVEPIFSPGNLWPGQDYGIMVEVEPWFPIANVAPLRFGLYFYFPPALAQAENLLSVGDELLCGYGRFPFPGDAPLLPPSVFGGRDRRRYAGLTIRRINGAPPPLQQSRPRARLQKAATGEYDAWLQARRPKPLAKPPARAPIPVGAPPSGDYARWLAAKRPGVAAK